MFRSRWCPHDEDITLPVDGGEEWCRGWEEGSAAKVKWQSSMTFKEYMEVFSSSIRVFPLDRRIMDIGLGRDIREDRLRHRVATSEELRSTRIDPNWNGNSPCTALVSSIEATIKCNGRGLKIYQYESEWPAARVACSAHHSKVLTFREAGMKSR